MEGSQGCSEAPKSPEQMGTVPDLSVRGTQNQDSAAPKRKDLPISPGLPLPAPPCGLKGLLHGVWSHRCPLASVYLQPRRPGERTDFWSTAFIFLNAVSNFLLEAILESQKGAKKCTGSSVGTRAPLLQPPQR